MKTPKEKRRKEVAKQLNKILRKAKTMLRVKEADWSDSHLQVIVEDKFIKPHSIISRTDEFYTFIQTSCQQIGLKGKVTWNNDGSHFFVMDEKDELYK